MSWNDYYRRRDALAAVLDYADSHPEIALPYHELPQVPEIFASERELLLALHHRWMQLLTGRIELAVADAERSQRADSVDAVAAAWRETCRQHPALRRVLDANADAFDGQARAAFAGEQRYLALSAGLAEHDEDAAEVATIGGTFLALVRNAPERERRRGRVHRLLRLVASA